MKLSVMALDYDGTIATNDALNPAIRDAIAAARASGIVVLIVTGRTLEDLQRVAGTLHVVDGVVAENGAVLHFPDSGYTSLLAPPVPSEWVDDLRRGGLTVAAGHCLVDASAADSPALLQAIRAARLPLVLVFNAGRVMVMPQGVSKATGLRAALDALRLSPRNALAIGDAENDHELLRLAEVGAAVSWGSHALQAAADLIVPGVDQNGLADWIRLVAQGRTLPPLARARRRLLLGYTDRGEPLSLAVRGRNVLIAGDAKSGKSWVAGLLCEQLITHGYSVCVLDPEGDYVSLEGLPGVTVLGGDDSPPTPRELRRALRYPDRSLVIDLSHLAQDEKTEYIRGALPALNEIRRQTGLPHRVLVDEAHYFLNDAGFRALIDLERNGYTFVTYSASCLPPQLLAAAEVMIVTRESSPVEVEALRKWCTTCRPVDHAQWEVLGHLKSGQAVALPITEESGGDLRVFNVAARLTPHVRHREKYVDVPVTDHKAFVFGAGATGTRARTLRQFVAALEGTPARAAAGFLRRGDFSRWIGDVFGDHALAGQLLRLEEQFCEGSRPDAIDGILVAIRERYDLADDSEPGAA